MEGVVETIGVDRQGRLVLPRDMRRRLGIPPGVPGEVVVSECADGVLIEAATREAVVTLGEDGFPLVHIEGIESLDNETVLEAIRRDRASR
jgi:bifunctional DNA-binding transcriptional regulator/antitoxin component of YhaV-PrlF toxin-antitoxin module